MAKTIIPWFMWISKYQIIQTLITSAHRIHSGVHFSSLFHFNLSLSYFGRIPSQHRLSNCSKKKVNNKQVKESESVLQSAREKVIFAHTSISSANTKGTPASCSHLCQWLSASSLCGGIRGGRKGRKKGEVKLEKEQKQQGLRRAYLEIWLHFRERVGGFEQTTQKEKVTLRQCEEKCNAKKKNHSCGKSFLKSTFKLAICINWRITYTGHKSSRCSVHERLPTDQQHNQSEQGRKCDHVIIIRSQEKWNQTSGFSRYTDAFHVSHSLFQVEVKSTCKNGTTSSYNMQTDLLL